MPDTALATVQDVEGIWQPLSDTQKTRASGLLEYASAMLRQAAPALDTWLADGRVSDVLVRATVANAVRRVLANPDGIVQESIDDYTSTRSSVIATGEVLFTPEEIAALRPAAQGGTGRAFTIRPGVSAR